jgi:predicted esterase
MRRLVLVLAALGLLVPASAGAAKPAHLVVAGGSGHVVGGKLRGWFVVANRGGLGSDPAEAIVQVSGGPDFLKVKIHWRARSVAIPALAPDEKYRARFAVRTPEGPRSMTHGSINVCLEVCRRLGRYVRPSTPPGPPSTPTTPGRSPAGPTPVPPDNGAAPLPPPSTVPSDPIGYVADEAFEVTSGTVPYWAYVPASYDPSNLTPAPLLIWLHGCGGESSGDIWVVDPGEMEGEPQDWISIAVGGREAECWTPSIDEAKVMAALADVETHFNVDRTHVVLGGYSSGGDLAYRTGFRHSSTFEGLLIENSSPFRDTESSAAESLTAATTKFPIVHLAHTGDATYPFAGVQKEIGEVAAAGFPVELIQRPGAHSDANTDSDLVEYLLPYMDGGWPG